MPTILADPDTKPDATPKKAGAALLLGALGIVYGDIGTSPIYTIRESFKAAGVGAATDPAAAEAAVLGVLSLVIWTVLIVVTFKYVVLVMRADNDGEGGIIALIASALGGMAVGRVQTGLLLLGVFGAALFYGDGMITPAISVLSAIEGLDVATPFFHPYILPITLVILIALFLVQSRGSDFIGRFFGPVMVVWFAVIGLAGVGPVISHPEVLLALDPSHGVRFVLHAPGRAFVTLGSVFLAVTGAEALYADMGHFTRDSIRKDWFILVLPALVLNYAGQSALVISDPSALDNPFFKLVPSWGLYPLVVLAGLATVIASQAVISGAFSLTQQAMQLGLLPRLDIRQTSEESAGQVYVPQVNWALMVAVIALVLAFRSSDNLAAAYGIAVTGTMVVTTVLLSVVMHRVWKWNLALTGLVTGALLVVDLTFFAANALKIPEGGWVPLMVAAAVFTLMTTWRRGRKLVMDLTGDANVNLVPFLRQAESGGYTRVPGTAVYLSSRKDQVPSALAENLRHNHVLHEHVVILTVISERQPRVAEDRRVSREEICAGAARIQLHFGYAEQPDLPATLREHFAVLRVDPDTASFFTGRELPVPAVQPALPRWREKLFAAMAGNAVSAARYFLIPSDRVIELGTQVEL